MHRKQTTITLRRSVLPRPFFLQDPVVVASDLLGMFLIHEVTPEDVRVGRIVETEAYRGTDDRACHAFAGKTPRARVLFGPAGRAYVYLVYGMHELFNVVTWPDGFAAAVLVRALEPVAGIDGSTQGPARLTKAMRITRAHNEMDLLGTSGLYRQRGRP
jgi:DNA-3-methyladenine glycosylase